MKVYISERDVLVSHKKAARFVSLFISFDSSREKKAISCIYCNQWLYNETGNVEAIADTEYDNGFASKEIICRKCKTHYIINQKIHPSQIYEQ